MPAKSKDGTQLQFTLKDTGEQDGRQDVTILMDWDVEIIVPDLNGDERAVVRVELNDGRLQALVWDGNAISEDGEPVIIPLLPLP